MRWSSCRRTFLLAIAGSAESGSVLSRTDDNVLESVDAAVAAGVPVAEFVAQKAGRFAELAVPLQLSNDDFIRTSTDSRHRPGVERLWRACTGRTRPSSRATPPSSS